MTSRLSGTVNLLCLIFHPCRVFPGLSGHLIGGFLGAGLRLVRAFLRRTLSSGTGVLGGLLSRTSRVFEIILDGLCPPGSGQARSPQKHTSTFLHHEKILACYCLRQPVFPKI